jgi:hypothetical protein
MKNKRLVIINSLWLLLLVLGFNACKKDVTTDFDYGIEPDNQKNLLCKALRLNGNNVDGTMPVGTGTGAPIIVSHPQAVEISAGVLLFIPYRVNDTNRVCKVYLQVQGADNYWETKLTLDPTSRQPYFKILIPKFVRDGDFNLVFSVGDCNGNVSRLYSTKTIVSPPADCNVSISGSVGITVRSFDLGDKAGRAGFSYEMYSIPDRLDIYYGGKWVASTGKLFDNSVVIPDCNGNGNGFVSGEGELTFDYDPKISSTVQVYISGCNSGTRWDVAPICPDEFALMGIQTSVSFNSLIRNVWDSGHAWITMTKEDKTTRYGLWPDYSLVIKKAGINNGSGSDVRVNFETGTGKFARFAYLSPSKQREVAGFVGKHWEYSLLSRNCATFAQKTWFVATGELLDANEFFNGSPTESPRQLGNSIIAKEAIKSTAHLRPKDVPQVNDPLDSFEQ